MNPEQEDIKAHSNALAFIQVEARDEAGSFAANNEAEIKVKVSGPALLQAAGNANPEHQGSFTDETFRLFRGRGLLIVRSTGMPGTVTVELVSSGLEKAVIALEAR